MVNQIKTTIAILLFLSAVSSAETILIKNAKIHTLGAQGSFNNGAILIIDGKISTIGTDIPEAEGYTIIDATGKELTPGIMNAATNLGLIEVRAIKTTVDYSTSEKDYSASFSIADVINPNSTLFAHNRINGLTRAMVIPKSDNSLFSGRGSLIPLSNDMPPAISTDNIISHWKALDNIISHWKAPDKY